MITITDQGTTGAVMEAFGYSNKRGLLGRMVLPVTRWLRAINVEKYTGPGERLLDIGCGDGYFLRRSTCRERYGLDKILGDEVSDRLEFPDDHFDYVTMLAVIEHVGEPDSMLREIHRVLKPGGKLVLTTPKEAAEFLIQLYVRDIEDEHEIYFDLPTMTKLTEGLFEITGYHTFIAGLNQCFCLQKPAG